jgi:hypothetical protein
MHDSDTHLVKVTHPKNVVGTYDAVEAQNFTVFPEKNVLFEIEIC